MFAHFQVCSFNPQLLVCVTRVAGIHQHILSRRVLVASRTSIVHAKQQRAALGELQRHTLTRRLWKQSIRSATAIGFALLRRRHLARWAGAAKHIRAHSAIVKHVHGLRRQLLSKLFWTAWSQFHVRKRQKAAVLVEAHALHRHQRRQQGLSLWLKAGITRHQSKLDAASTRAADHAASAVRRVEHYARHWREIALRRRRIVQPLPTSSRATVTSSSIVAQHRDFNPWETEAGLATRPRASASSESHEHSEAGSALRYVVHDEYVSSAVPCDHPPARTRPVPRPLPLDGDPQAFKSSSASMTARCESCADADGLPSTAPGVATLTDTSGCPARADIPHGFGCESYSRTQASGRGVSEPAVGGQEFGRQRDSWQKSSGHDYLRVAAEPTSEPRRVRTLSCRPPMMTPAVLWPTAEVEESGAEAEVEEIEQQLQRHAHEKAVHDKRCALLSKLASQLEVTPIPQAHAPLVVVRQLLSQCKAYDRARDGRQAAVTKLASRIKAMRRTTK